MNRNSSRITRLIIYMVLSLSVVFVVFPLLYAFLGSFKTSVEFIAGSSSMMPSGEWRWQNYTDAWKLANFGRYTVNSIVYASFSVLGVLFTASMTGYALSRSRFRIKNMLIGSFGITLFVTGTITLYPIFKLCTKLGWTSSLLGMTLVQIAVCQPVYCILVTNYVEGISHEIDEAARIDGCSFFRTYWNIILPVIKPILASVAILSFRDAWNNFMMPQAFTLSKPQLRTLTVGVVALRDQGEGISAWNLMIAGTVMALLPIIVVYLFLNRYFIAGMTEGAVKG